MKLHKSLLTSLLTAVALSASAQGTAFTYQGRLNNSGSPASGTYDLTFSLFNTNISGVAIAGPVTNAATGVTNGLFTVAIDFGPGVFTGQSNWLEIAVATNGVGTFTTLAPRQQLTPMPYAIYAESASGLSGTLSASQLTSIGNTNGGDHHNFFVGPSGNSTMTGWQNTANGVTALQNNTSGYGNTADGFAALLHNVSGHFNTANGVNALQQNTNGNYNTANGGNTLVYNTSGSQNTANGFQALFSNTSGNYNTADGGNTLLYNTTGSQNTANGSEALYNNTTGSQNTANGNSALHSNTNGNNNTAIGVAALYYNTSGSANIALGVQAGNFITTGSSNICIGNVGLSTDTNIIRIGSGQTQTFIAGVINGNGGGLTNLNASTLTGVIPPAQMPAAVLTNNETGVMLTGTFSGNGSGLTSLDASQLTSVGNTNGGSGNFFVGGSGNSTNSGSGNTANGVLALVNNTSGSVNTANGFFALLFNTSGSANTANGYGTLVLNTNGSWNTANGVEALWNNTEGSFNTADGAGALLGNTSGSNNIALGYFAGINITIGSSNIVIGNQGLSTDANIIRIGDGQTQTFIAGVINGNGSGLTGLDASQLTSIGNASGGYNNFFVGPSGNSTMSGNGNTANGVGALRSNTGGTANMADGNGALNNNTGGYYNTASGYAALYGNTIGSFNAANGAAALGNNTDGSHNTASGNAALYYNTSGNNNTANGNEALHYSTNGSDNIALGYRAGYNLTGSESGNIVIGNPGVTGDTNIIRIGTTQTATYLAGTVYADGVALTCDRNAKENFTAINTRDVLARVMSLPVTAWNYKTDGKGVQHIGPMAQDFQAAFQLGTDDKHISVVDEGGVALAAIQGLNQKLNEKDAEIQDLKQSVADLKKLVQSFTEKK
jgi:trimeric autotransporter adhesin